jgi:sulfotransferase
MHFITGLPRAGTTLLGAILRQNPRFSAGMSSPLAVILDRCIDAMSPAANEFALQFDNSQRALMIDAMIKAYCKGTSDAEVVFDTNRLWAARLPLIAHIQPQAKVIACVRNPAWVVDSIECLIRANPLGRSRIFNSDAERMSVYSRADTLMQPNRMVGFALNAMKEAIRTDESDRLLLVEYDFLVARPQDTMQLIYDFIDEPWFDHDFENVDYDSETFDMLLGMPGLHRVRRKVALQPRHSVLPPDLFEGLAARVFWRDLTGSNARAIALGGTARPLKSTL